MRELAKTFHLPGERDEKRRRLDQLERYGKWRGRTGYSEDIPAPPQSRQRPPEFEFVQGSSESLAQLQVGGGGGLGARDLGIGLSLGGDSEEQPLGLVNDQWPVAPGGEDAEISQSLATRSLKVVSTPHSSYFAE